MGDTLQLVSFTVDERLYGLDVRIVKEINPLATITQVPRAPATIKGLVNVRGQVVLVLDLAVVFGREPTLKPGSQIVILKTDAELANLQGTHEGLPKVAVGDKPVGFAVDAVDDVVTVPLEAIEPVPPHVDPGNARFLSGVARHNDELQLLLNAREVLSSDEEGAGI